MMALRKAVEDDIIDCIATHHRPQDWDNKVCEFEYAKPGMIGLESCFRVINQVCPALTDAQLIRLFSTNARNIFKLPPSILKEGAVADLTLFERSSIANFSLNDIKSKSKNSAFIGQQLKGSVIGIVNKEQVYLNI
jgi:dihydroorotase